MDIPPGDIWLTTFAGAMGKTGRLHVDHADPQIGISAPLLRMIRAGDCHPDVTIDGDVLAVNAENGRWVYRIGDYHPVGLPDHGESGWWYAEWPD